LFFFPFLLLPGIGESELDPLGVGNIYVIVEVDQITTSRTLTEVLYVPGLGSNLFSVSAATRRAWSRPSKLSIITWHCRLGNIGYHTLLKMVKEDLTVGLNINGDRDIPATLCSNCEFGKFSRIPLKTGRKRATRIGELTHSDVWGPIATTSIGGARYFVTFKDDYSGYTTVYFVKRKNKVPALIRL
jgi:hypothetical protein